MKHTRNAWRDLSVIVAIAAVLGLALPSYAIATQCMVFAMAAIGGTFLLGQVGLLSFAQAAYFGAGAYAAGLAGIRLGFGSLGMIAVGMLFAAVVGALIGLCATRRRGVYFIMMTLALGQLAYFVSYAMSDWTGGDNGLSDVPRGALSIAGFGGLKLDSPLVFYVFVVGCLLLAYAVLLGVARSPLGTSLAAIRENENRAIAAGYNVYLLKVSAMALSAAVVGAAGALYAMFLRFAPLNNVDFTMVEHLVLITLFGGTGSLLGGVFGGVAFELLSHVLSSAWDRWLLLLGLALIAVGVWMQGGLWGAYSNVLRRFRGAPDEETRHDRRHA